MKIILHCNEAQGDERRVKSCGGFSINDTQAIGGRLKSATSKQIFNDPLSCLTSKGKKSYSHS